MGPIPFWRIPLDESTLTFDLVSLPVPADEQNFKCTRFPVIANGDRRMVLKLTDDNQLLVYNEDDESWQELTLAEDSDLEVNSIY